MQKATKIPVKTDADFKKQFWENKIRVWEKNRYVKADASRGLTAFLKKSTGSSLQFRLEKTAQILTPCLSGKTVLEIGCGSGLLYDKLKGSGINHYIGIDLASGAIENAKLLARENNAANKTTFLAGNILEIEFPPFDIAVALGLLDWLDKDEIDLLFKKIFPRKFIFSISERTFSPSRLLHALYVYISYGWKTRGYVPKYYSTDEITAIAQKHGYEKVRIYRDKRLRFGAFLYQFD